MWSKQEIRRIIRQRKNQISPLERETQSVAVCRSLLQDEHWIQAKTVMLYHALPDELDTRLLLESDKKVVLPVVVGDDIKLKTYERNKMLPGAFGIWEPATEHWFEDYELIDMVIVPGVAFTASGKRLGRGKGYYDRFLPLVPHAYKIGVCYQQQLITDLPTEPYDQLMDKVISYQTQDLS